MAPRSARPGAGTYLPPHLRAGNAGNTQQQRSLDELAPHNMIIKLEYTAGGPFSLERCPDNIVEQPHQQLTEQQQQAEVTEGNATATPQQQLHCVHIESPACPDSFQMNELLDWFTKASTVQQLPDFPEGDTRAVLSLPSAVSKYERAKWHSAAQRAGLDSASQGVGADRFLQISPRPLLHPPASADPAASSGTHSTETHNSNRVHHSSVKDTAGSCSWRQKRAADASGTDTALAADSSDAWPPEGRSGSAKPNKPFKPRHKQVWDWCQLEGGAFWNYSQGEIRELLNSGGQMPPELQQIIQKRETNASLCEALQQRDESTALALLAAAPPGTKLSWVRDQESGGYPTHIAAFHGLGNVLKQLVARDGVEILQQHDARRSTPVTLAQQQGHQQLSAELEQLRVEALTSGSVGRMATDPSSGISNAAPPGGGSGFSSRRPSDQDSSSDTAAAGPVTTVYKQCSHAQSSGLGDGPGSAVNADSVEAARADTVIERYSSYDSKDDRAFLLYGRGRGASSRGRNSSRGQDRTDSSRW